MPPRVFMPIRSRRRQSEARAIDPMVKRMTKGSLLIGLGFLTILAGVLVTIFAMKPKSSSQYRRPMRNYIIGQPVPPSRTTKSQVTPTPEDIVEGVNVSMILGPVLAVLGVITCLVGAIFYAVSYQKKKQKDKEANRQSALDEEATRENSPIESSPSAVNLACPEVATSVSDIQLNTTQTSEGL